MVKFEEIDFKNWQHFREVKKNTLSNMEFKMISDLHARYYNHKFHKPCTCNPKKIKSWINELNVIWNNGVKKS